MREHRVSAARLRHSSAQVKARYDAWPRDAEPDPQPEPTIVTVW